MKKSVRSWLGKSVLLTLIISFSALCLSAQVKFEAGVSIGPSNFLGDLGGRLGKGQTFIKDNNFKLQLNYVRKTFSDGLTPSRNFFLGQLQTSW